MKATGVRRRVRPMSLADIPQVEEIEREAFPTSWPPSAFQHELRFNRIARYLVAVEEAEDAPSVEPPAAGGLGRVLVGLRRALASTDGPAERVLGYLGLWLPADEAHIVSIAVRASHRRQGVGELLLLALIDRAIAAGARWVTLEVRVSNQVALSLYRKYTFKEMGVRKRYYSDNNEDALIMWTEPLDSPEFRRVLEENRRRLAERLARAENGRRCAEREPPLLDPR